ncbi:Serine/threonine protein kinase [Serratia symbiotica str. 'Cinara cedri']|nr:Serine/threonine protein kinase [Serratia symbiotica str. 'Cinara cedri']
MLSSYVKHSQLKPNRVKYMKTPKLLQPLVDDGLIDNIIRRLKSGKEADVFIVRCGQEIRCAKVYKEAKKRTFKHAVHYQEGRKTRNSRNARAISKNSKFGRQQQDIIWQQTEIETLCLLTKLGVRVPQPDIYINGVLIMELITDKEGQAAPRLSDISLTPEQARKDYALIINYAVRMLCAGLVHGDLSAFNVLMNQYGPVIIDLPQVINASANKNAKNIFERDINNMSLYYSQYAPDISNNQYSKEIWELYQQGRLTQESILSGRFTENYTLTDISVILKEIQYVSNEHQHQLLMRNQNK